MKFIKERDLNDKEVDKKLLAMWKARYYGVKFDTSWTHIAIIVEKTKKIFNITLQELTILESILWAERITISSLSIYLNKKVSNISRVVSTLIKRGILKREDDRTLNITEEFAKKWYTFFEKESSNEWLDESIEEIIPKLELAISMMTEALEVVKKEKESK